MSTPLPEISPWYDYDPETGVGNPSTPIKASRLNGWADEVRGVAQEAVDRAEAAADEAESVVTGGVDAATATNLTNPASATRSALNGVIDGEIVPDVIDELAGAVVQRSGTGVSALPLTGSRGTGNLQVGPNVAGVSPVDTWHNGFPGFVRCADGSLLASYRRADGHANSTVSTIVMTRSYDFGRTWSPTWTVFSDVSDGYGMFTRLASGRLALVGQSKVGAVGSGATGTYVAVSYSSDNGSTWSAPVKVPFTHTDWTYYSGNLVELADGAQVVMAYGHNTGATSNAWSVRVMRSTNGGATWTNEVTIADGTSPVRDYSEGTVNLLPDGSIMALFRSDVIGSMQRSVSTDGGLTWSAPTSVFTGTGRPAWILLDSGAVVCTYRAITGSAHVIRTSWDNGLTWSAERQVAPVTTQSVYSQIEQVSSGLVGMIYADEVSSTQAATRFKYLMDGAGGTPLGDTAGDTGYNNTGWTVGSGWSLADSSGFSGLSWRIKGGWAFIYGIGTKASFAANEVIATAPWQLRPDRIITNGRYRIDPDGSVRVVAAGTTNTIVELTYPVL